MKRLKGVSEYADEGVRDWETAYGNGGNSSGTNSTDHGNPGRARRRKFMLARESYRTADRAN